MGQNRKLITTDRQLVWWITHLRHKWCEDYQVYWYIQVNEGHWASLWLSDKMIESLRGDGRQISCRYCVRIISAYADLPRRLEVRWLETR